MLDEFGQNPLITKLDVYAFRHRDAIKAVCEAAEDTFTANSEEQISIAEARYVALRNECYKHMQILNNYINNNPKVKLETLKRVALALRKEARLKEHEDSL